MQVKQRIDPDGPRVICPSGCPAIFVSSPRAKNFSLSPSGKSPLPTRPVPSPRRGVSRSSRTWGGMRWTQAALLTRALWLRTAKSCGP